MTTTVRTLARLALLSSVLTAALPIAACGGGGSATPATPPGPPPPARPCEEAFEDLVKYYKADPDRRRPASFTEGAFVSTCQELPLEAQRCMLFSYMQAHANQCDQTLNQAPPEVMRRLASIGGR